MPSYQVALDRFDGVKTQVLGLSVDSVPCLKAWADSLGGITYPLLSDFYPHGKIAIDYGVLRPEGYSERAIFIIDKMGFIRYIDIHNIDEQPDNEVLFRELERLEPQAASAYLQSQAKNAPASAPASVEEPIADVVMYCTPWCPECRMAREYLSANGIQWVEVDITRDRSGAERVRDWANGNEVTPTFKVKGTVIIGYDKRRLNKALGLW